MKQYEIIGLAYFGILLTAVAANGQRLTTTNAPAAIPWSQVGVKAGADYKGDGLAVTPTDSGARLHCVFQRLDGEATCQGLWLTSTVTNGASDHFRVTAVAIGRKRANEPCNSWSPESTIQLTGLGNVSVEGQTVRFVRPGLSEEYSVSMDGVRQDFVVTEKPPGVGPLNVRLSVSGAKVATAPCGAQLVLEKSGRKLAYSRLRATDATGKELPADIQAEQNSAPTLTAVVNDTDAVYPVRVDPTFSDANWISMNAFEGISGSELGELEAAVVDGSGNLYIGGHFPEVGNILANNIARWDGTSWSAFGSGIGGVGNSYDGGAPTVSAIAILDGNVYAAGAFTLAGGVTVNNIARWDGTNWQALGSGLILVGDPAYTQVNALALLNGTLYAGGNFTAAGNVAASCVAQWDGTSWSPLGSGMEGVEASVNALAVSGGTLYAGGGFTTAGGNAANCIAQWNGSAWSPLGSGMNGGVGALAVSGGMLYAGGGFTTAGNDTNANCIAQWNGSNWSSLGSGISGAGFDGFGPYVYALAVSGTTLYVGGEFTMAGGNAASNIAQWNGSRWSPLSSGISGEGLFDYGTEVYALAMSGSALFAAGNFGMAGGNSASCLAQWNGSSWSPMGSGLNGKVNALTVAGGILYAGGYFPGTNGEMANGIVQWNGSTWLPLAAGINGSVSALAVSDGTLYAGGYFTMAGGSAANYVAQWNGSSWSPLGSGLGYGVNALAVSGGSLYAGGNFTSAGGNAANYIAQWNGSSWSPLGSGMNNYLYALAVSDGTLYAGGDFTMAGGKAANSVAQWNGSGWSPLGSGVNGRVSALAVLGGILYVGGNFASAGGGAANRIAQWNGSSWSPLGSGMSDVVNVLAVSGGALYAGGYFFTAGGVTVRYIAQWNGGAWSALGSGMSDYYPFNEISVNALAMSGGTMYVGGDFAGAGETVSPSVVGALIAPSIQFTATPTIGLDPLTVNFTSPSNDNGNNTVVSWNWNFGDSSASTNQNPSHLYSAAGTYYPTLLATNSLGETVYGSGPASILVTNTMFDYTITLIASPSQGGLVSGGGTYASGGSQTVMANASNGYSFSDWTEGGAVVSSSSKYTFTVTSNVSLVANFVSTTPTNTAALVTNGYGGITHAAWPKNLVNGKKYTVTAAPKAKNIFVNWLGGTNRPYSVLSTSPSYTFTFEPNLVLEANFVTNLFLAAQGAYNGLFAPMGEARKQTNSGAFTLNVTSEGSLSGDLYLGSATPIVLNGKFAPDGTATIVNKRKGENTLSTTLMLYTSSQTIGGNVTDGSFVAQLSGFQSVFSAKNKAPFTGTYTLVIPGVINPEEGPYGDSYGTVTVSSSGAISFAGSLADGTAVSRASAISQNGAWPFYLALYNGNGSFYSWNSFSDDVSNGVIIFSTNGSWINETNSSKTALYRSGFTNQNATVAGSIYAASQTLPAAMTVTLDGGGLAFALTNGVAVGVNDKITLTNSSVETNKLTLTINRNTGVVSGSFANPANAKQIIKVGGVIFQNETNAQGYFSGTNESGAFLIENE